MKKTNTTDRPILHICAPASPVGDDLNGFGIASWADLHAATDKAVGVDWRITGNPNLIWAPLQPHGRTDDAARAADLQSALADDRVQAVVPLRGGAWLLRILEQTDVAVLNRRRKPLFLFGFSEWTCLSLLAARYPSVVSIHHTTPLYLLATDPHNPLSQKQKQQRWNQIWASIHAILAGKDPRRSAKGKLVTSYNLTRSTIQVIGGNLTLMAAMAGTPYQPAAMALAGNRRAPATWLFIEDINETIGSLDRKLTQMRLAGMFKGAAGILVGGFHSDGHDASLTVAALLREHVPASMPIIAGINVGHTWPAAPLPIGQPVQLIPGPRNTVRIQVNWPTLGQ